MQDLIFSLIYVKVLKIPRDKNNRDKNRGMMSSSKADISLKGQNVILLGYVLHAINLADVCVCDWM